MAKNKALKKGTRLTVIGLLFLAAALMLALYNRWDADRADQAAQEAVTLLIERIPGADTTGNHRAARGNGNPYEAFEETTPEMATEEIDGNLYIGILEIPSLGLTLPVMADWDYSKLSVSPCRFSGSYYTDDLVIAGHNYARHFSPLKWIDLNTDVYFTNVEGDVFHYTVDNVETLQPTQVDEMISGNWDLTMFTCTTGGQSRCSVRCIKVIDE